MSLVAQTLIWVSFLGLSQAAFSQSAGGKPTYWMCRNQKLVRTIRVVETAESCSTIYTKLGIDRVVGQGKNPISCFNVMDNIKTNLEGASWKCKDISNAKVSRSSSL